MEDNVYPDLNFKFEQKDDYLYAFVTGPRDDLNISKYVFNKIYLKAVESGYKKVLIEEDFPNQLTTVEMFKIGEYIAKIFKRDFKIAHVDRSLTDMDLNSFGETVAVNRGIIGKIFNNMTDAEIWLKE